MRRPLMTAVLFLGAFVTVLAADVSGQDQPRPSGRTSIPTVTRLVKVLGGLEDAWLAAVRNKDESTLAALLADDFEMRLASRPGEPVSRADWIKHALAFSSSAWTLHQMAARDIGCAVLVSFRMDPGTTTGGARPVFVVDTWVQGEGTWKAVARYVAAADERMLGLPGEVAAPASLHKK